MGLYDRDYIRDDDRQGVRLGGNRSMVINLILVCVGLYLVDLFSPKTEGSLHVVSQFLSLPSQLISEPWHVYGLFTYAFAHSAQDIMHILVNMFFLWLFGRGVESIYGRQQFLRLFLTFAFAGGVVWLVLYNLRSGAATNLIGASGAVTGVMVLFALHYPRHTLYIWGLIPVPVWLIVGLYVLQDVFGFVSRSPENNVAYEVHLAGAACAFVFLRTQWTLWSLLPGGLSLARLKSRPKLRIHAPEEDKEGHEDRLDAILEKISREGESSLTRRERRFLENASRRAQHRRR